VETFVSNMTPSGGVSRFYDFGSGEDKKLSNYVSDHMCTDTYKRQKNSPKSVNHEKK
jgi:hypothetical protein